MATKDHCYSDQTVVTGLISRYRNALSSCCEREAMAIHLFKFLHPWALQFAKSRMPKSFYDAEQVALDSVAKLFKCYFENRLHDFQADREVFSLLKVITSNSKNEMIRKWKALARAPRNENGNAAFPVSLQLNGFNVRSSSVDPATTSEHMDQVRQCLTQLSDPFLCEFLRLRMDGLAYPEIAERLGLNKKEVRSSVRFIRKMLRSVLLQD